MSALLIPSLPQLTGRRRLLFAALFAAIAGMILLGGVFWPFREAAFVRSLREATCTQVSLENFHPTYFPRPGAIVENAVFSGFSARTSPPLATIRTLTVQSSLFGLIRKHISFIRAEGMEVNIPRGQAASGTCSPSRITVDELTAPGAILNFESRDPGKAPTRFVFRTAIFRGLNTDRSVSFTADFSNPEPPGQISASGRFGPWKDSNPFQTPVSGEYSFQNVDLGVFKGITGILTSEGKFEGVLDQIAVRGTTETPRFRVASSSHEGDLKTRFAATVSAKTGNVFLTEVAASIWQTTFSATGSVENDPKQDGRVTRLEISTKDGRVQDLLKLFIKDERSPLGGTVSFRSHVILPPQKHPFLKVVELTGDFGIAAGEFSNSSTQERIDKLSAESREQNDQNPPVVLSDLNGHVDLRNGVAAFSGLSFHVPGVAAEMHGTYGLISEHVDLHGTMKLDSTLSHTAHGGRALLLKVIEPFFKRHPKGSEVPVKIAGTYQRPSFGLDLGARKENKVEKRLEHLYQHASK